MTTGIELNYTDPGTGQNFPNAWIVVVNSLYGTPTVMQIATSFTVQIDIYVDEDSYLNGKQPIFPNRQAMSVIGDDYWNSYFNPAIAQNIANQAYAFLIVYLTSQPYLTGQV